jgi:hypothetical protein
MKERLNEKLEEIRNRVNERRVMKTIEADQDPITPEKAYKTAFEREQKPLTQRDIEKAFGYADDEEDDNAESAEKAREKMLVRRGVTRNDVSAEKARENMLKEKGLIKKDVSAKKARENMLKRMGML